MANKQAHIELAINDPLSSFHVANKQAHIEIAFNDLLLSFHVAIKQTHLELAFINHNLTSDLCQMHNYH